MFIVVVKRTFCKTQRNDIKKQQFGVKHLAN